MPCPSSNVYITPHTQFEHDKRGYSEPCSSLLSKQTNKTFIGKVERGFNFLSYFMKPIVLRVSRGTFERFTERISQLYEQGAGVERIVEYVKH